MRPVRCPWRCPPWAPLRLFLRAPRSFAAVPSTSGGCGTAPAADMPCEKEACHPHGSFGQCPCWLPGPGSGGSHCLLPLGCDGPPWVAAPARPALNPDHASLPFRGPLDCHRGRPKRPFADQDSLLWPLCQLPLPANDLASKQPPTSVAASWNCGCWCCGCRCCG